MDDFLKDMDSLFTMANKAGKAPPLAVDEVMERIRDRAPSEAASPAAPILELPLRFMIGAGTAAAAAAVLFVALSLSTWQSLNDPFAVARFLPDVLGLLEN